MKRQVAFIKSHPLIASTALFFLAITLGALGGLRFVAPSIFAPKLATEVKLQLPPGSYLVLATPPQTPTQVPPLTATPPAASITIDQDETSQYQTRLETKYTYLASISLESSSMLTLEANSGIDAALFIRDGKAVNWDGLVLIALTPPLAGIACVSIIYVQATRFFRAARG